jgi:hypothetical protein
MAFSARRGSEVWLLLLERAVVQGCERALCRHPLSPRNRQPGSWRLGSEDPASPTEDTAAVSLRPTARRTTR